jgi:hypothetical protein
VPEGLSVPVVGPSTIFPRGYLWLAPLWCAAALAGLAVARWLPIWFRITAAAGLFVAMVTVVSVLSAITLRAFSADASGVTLGLTASTRRRGRHRTESKYLPWPQIEKVRIGRRPNSVQVEFILGPNASLALRGYKHNPIWKVRRALLLLIPFWYLLRPTGLASPLDGPPRYRVNLHGTTVDEIRKELRDVAPANVTVTVLVRKRASVSSGTRAPEALRRSA